MRVFSLSVQQKRRAIELGLATFIEDRHVLDRALAHWDAHYQDKPMYVLNRFIYEVCDQPQLRSQRSVILKTLMAEMLRIEKLSTEIDAVDVTVSTDETLKLRQGMITILEYFFSATASVDQTEFQELYASRLTKEMKLTGTIEFHDLPTQYWTHLLESKQYLRVINLIYEAYCEFYGPIQADQVLSRARQKIKQDEPSLDLSHLF